jgi:hypothetical protein
LLKFFPSGKRGWKNEKRREVKRSGKGRGREREEGERSRESNCGSLMFMLTPKASLEWTLMVNNPSMSRNYQSVSG